ncbi:MAG: hypothetical protein KGD64_11085 [Candidatus Heimdallarchaeota archaeon]|nr:hypothetical protein [Candidatus Heimdallarchaeota archaeon]
MSCSRQDKIISTPSLGDETRRVALKTLIQEGCLTSLYNHAFASSRIDWIRNYSLLALAKFATINTSSNEVAITLQDDEIPLSNEMDTFKLKKKAARLLFMFTTTVNKPRKFKKISLMGLIAGEHWDYCEELERDSTVEEWIKKTIYSAMKTKK